MKVVFGCALALFLVGCQFGIDASRSADRPAPHLFTSSLADVTRQAGLQWRHHNGARGRKQYPETVGGGGGFVDVDGDGWLDMVLIDSAPPPGRDTVALLLSRPGVGGERHFVDGSAARGLRGRYYGMGVTAGDVDGDGDADLYVTAVGSNHLYLNDGRGRFRELTANAGYPREAWVDGDPRFSTSAAFVDYDVDGDLDLFVCRYLRWEPRTEAACYAGDQVRVYCPPPRYPGEPSALFRNEGRDPRSGSIRFRDVTVPLGLHSPAGKSLGVAVCDLNQDNLPDLYVANDLEPNQAFIQGPDHRFRDEAPELGLAVSPAGRPRAGMGVDARPLGLGSGPSVGSAGGQGGRDPGSLPLPPCPPSLLVGNFQTEGVALFAPADGASGFLERTEETGLLRPTLNSLTFGCGLLDLNRDGYLDAVLLNGHVEPDVARYQPGQRYRQRPQLFLGRPEGTFVDVSDQAGPPFQRSYVGRGLAWGDYDNDGDLDLLAIENNGPAHLWRNESPGRHWLTVVPRRGMGARVTVRAGGRTQEQLVRTGSSYLSVSDPRPNFGLGDAAVAEEVVVRWPDGREERRLVVPADQFVTFQ